MGKYWKIKIGKPSWGAKGQSSSSGRGLAIHSLRKGDDLVRMTQMTPVTINPERAVCRLSKPTADQPHDSRSNTVLAVEYIN